MNKTIIMLIIIFYNNNNNNNLYITRVTQSNTGFDFRCGPPIYGLYLSCFMTVENCSST